jgi:hypothetical protein
LSNLEADINEWINYQMLFADSVTPFEQALTLVFTDKQSEVPDYDGKQDDKSKILSECERMQDITGCLQRNRGKWNFEKTPFWKMIYG